jgi:hypothetical protein
MFTSLLFTAAIWPLAVTQGCTPEANTIMVGVAHNTAGIFLYCELVSQADETSLHVRYTQKEKLFAEKNLDFSHNPFMPSVLQTDFRSGELRKADISAPTVTLSYQPNTHKEISISNIATQKVDVVDAGFDNFIRANWGALTSGKILAVNFASIAHLKAMPLRISAKPLDTCLNQSTQSTASFCFLVEVDNALLRLLLGNIKLVYDQQQRLVHFNGVVNIADNQESTQTATITYYYKQDYAKK